MLARVVVLSCVIGKNVIGIFDVLGICEVFVKPILDVTGTQGGTNCTILQTVFGGFFPIYEDFLVSKSESETSNKKVRKLLTPQTSNEDIPNTYPRGNQQIRKHIWIAGIPKTMLLLRKT